MSEETLLTLRQLAAELRLPESTIRYYRDAFLDHIPSVGTGRRRRYPTDAVAVLRSIADGYSAGRTRSEILGALQDEPGAAARMVSLGPGNGSRAVSIDQVSNLDLLAAILDGEREQRDALWQMAKEIVRLTQVLEGQDKVLTEIADRAGVMVDGGRRVTAGQSPVAAIGAAPGTTTTFAATDSSAAAAPPPDASPSGPIFGGGAAPAPAPHRPEPPTRDEASSRKTGDDSAMEKLRAELESERALVERLREAKLQIEHRAADAEAALDERKPKRPSVIARLLGNKPGQ